MGKRPWHGRPVDRDTRSRDAAVALVIILFLLVSSVLVYDHEIHDAVARHHQSLNDAFDSIPNEDLINSTGGDFAPKARKVSVLADLAELHTEQPSLNHTLLGISITSQFPWWNSSTLAYLPWRFRRTYEPWAEGQHQPKTGIVVSVGEPIIWEAAHLIATFRNVHRSSIPIQIAYAGDSHLSPAGRDFLTSFGDNLHFIDLTRIFNDSLIGLSGCAMKPFAILASRYPRTILVNADMVFFHKPDGMFNTYGALKETGALFFHDRSKSINLYKRNTWLRDQLLRSGREASIYLTDKSLFHELTFSKEADSAMVAVDLSRPRQYLAMVFAAWMNTNSTRAFTYKMFHGDKETYWLANELTSTPYAFEPWSTAQLATTYDGQGNATIEISCTNHIAHSLPNGRDIFWANGTMWRDKRHKTQGFAQWTHWYLDQPTGEAVKSDDKTKTDWEAKPSATHPVWDGEQECSRHDEKGWKKLSGRSKRVNRKLLAEARRVQERFERLKGDGKYGASI